MSKKALLAFDTDRIKDYVFATDRLNEIRGASSNLDILNREKMLEEVHRIDSNARKIYALGGAGLFVVEANKADAAHLAVERAYRADSGGAASVTGTNVKLPDDFGDQSDVRKLFKLLQLRLRIAKDRPIANPAAISLPFVRPCDACGEFPAKHTVKRHNETRLLCEACKQRQLGRTYWDQYAPKGLSGIWPEDFSELGEHSSPRGYIGLIYADGNAMGREAEQQPTLADLERFAHGVDRALKQASDDAVMAHLDMRKENFVPLLQGGDDLVMLTRAQSAIEVAITLTDEFCEYTEHNLGKRLSLSVGVVLAHATFPFRVMLELAESALKFAKKEAVKRELPAEERGLINFMVISSANHVDFKSYYEQTLEDIDGHPRTMVRTRRPYTPSELRNLIAKARDLRQPPRNKLQILAECVFMSFEQSRLEGLVALHRWRDGQTEGMKREQVDTLWNLVGQGESNKFPWRVVDVANNIYETPLLDLVEIFDFVKGADDVYDI